MARLGIVFGLILCALTFAGLVASTEKSPTQFFPMMLGIPVLFCGVVALNPHRRRASMHAAASLALLGSLAGGGRVVFCLLQIARGGEVNRHGLNLLIAMTLVCTLFAVICVISFALMRRRRVQAASVARVGSIGLHQPQPGMILSRKHSHAKVHNEAFIFSRLLDAFTDVEPLRQRLVIVLSALPEEVLRDFLHDPRFHITKITRRPSSDLTLLALPTPDGRGSRCVVLKQRLADCSEPFGLYVIAHELAHAFLHNGAWGEISDPEEAADALAASWGFPRP